MTVREEVDWAAAAVVGEVVEVVVEERGDTRPGEVVESLIREDVDTIVVQPGSG